MSKERSDIPTGAVSAFGADESASPSKRTLMGMAPDPLAALAPMRPEAPLRAPTLGRTVLGPGPLLPTIEPQETRRGEAVELSAGDMFARTFHIVRRVAEGRRSTVYEATLDGHLRPVALKVFHRTPAIGEEEIHRFVHDTRVGARAESRHLAVVHRAGYDATHECAWTASELLDGETLANYLARTDGAPLPSGDAWRVLLGVAHALARCHAHRVAHGDLRPSNVMLLPGPGGFEVKLLDVGTWHVDALFGRDADDLDRRAWRAPEQTLHERTAGGDVWSFGMLAFLAFTGRRYPLDDVRVPAPASVRAAAVSRAELIPLGFDAFFARCTAADPTLRFPTAMLMGQTLAALRPATDDVPVIDYAARTPSMPAPPPSRPSFPVPPSHRTGSFAAAPPPRATASPAPLATRSSPPPGPILHTSPPHGSPAFRSSPPQGTAAFRSSPPQGTAAFRSSPPQGTSALRSSTPPPSYDPSRDPWRSPGTRSSAPPPLSPTGQFRAANPTGQHPAAASPTGQFRAANPTGQHPAAASPTGQFRAAPITGPQSAATRTGQHRAAGSTGPHGAATLTGPHRAASATGSQHALTQASAQIALRETTPAGAIPLVTPSARRLSLPTPFEPKAPDARPSRPAETSPMRYLVAGVGAGAAFMAVLVALVVVWRDRPQPVTSEAASLTPAQPPSREPAPVPDARRWRGSLSGEDGEWTFVLSLRTRDGRATGWIAWSAVRVPGARVGEQVRENVEGTFEAGTGAYELHGIASSNPSLLPVNAYRLQAAGDGTLSGHTLDVAAQLTASPAN